MKKQTHFIFLMLLCFQLLSIIKVLAAGAPTLYMLHVQDNGDGLLQWSNPADMSDFKQYNIYRSDDNGNSFVFVSAITSDIVTGQVDIVNPSDYQYCYYVEFQSITDQKYRSDTLCEMNLALSYATGVVHLEWNSPTSPPLPSYRYEIYRKFTWDNYTLLGRIAQTQFNDTITVCDREVKYFVQLQLSSQFESNRSPVKSGIFKDVTPPVMPVLDSITVNYSTRKTELGWQPSSSPDVNGYIIYWNASTTGGYDFRELDTVYGVTHWIDNVHDAATKVYQYKIAAMDSCGNPSPATLYQNTILLAHTIDECEKSATFSWNSYQNMTGNVASYKIYVSENSGNLFLAGTIASTQTTFTLRNLNNHSNYRVIVRAVNSSGQITAASASDEFLFEVEETPYSAYISLVTVEENKYIRIKVLTNGNSYPFSKLNLYKSLQPDYGFTLFQTVNYQSGNPNFQFEDHDVDVQKNIYYYKAEIIGECENGGIFSNISHNILLTGEASASKINHLDAPSYESWQDGVMNYLIYRKMQMDTAFENIGSVPPSFMISFEDDVTDLFSFGSDFLYYMVAIPSVDDPARLEESMSNTILLKQMPTTYLPNAFCPNPASPNKVFMPINAFVDANSYLFVIYNRWGQVVFSTSNPYQGWDGTYKGQECPSGVYSYRLKYRYPDGAVYENSGSVTLLR